MRWSSPALASKWVRIFIPFTQCGLKPIGRSQTASTDVEGVWTFSSRVTVLWERCVTRHHAAPWYRFCTALRFPKAYHKTESGQWWFLALSLLGWWEGSVSVFLVMHIKVGAKTTHCHSLHAFKMFRVVPEPHVYLLRGLVWGTKIGLNGTSSLPDCEAEERPS